MLHEALTIAAYIECAIWASTTEDGTPLDHSPAELAPDTIAAMTHDTSAFLNMIAAEAIDHSDWTPEQLGHDFWLTRNRHGAGFWDRGHGETGKRLTDCAHAFGECWLYIGDDGLIYLA